jgi:tRNA nucleotidyltransferase (CCA-adding enzyme)
LLCCEADARGRTGFEERDYPQADYLRAALVACQSVNVAEIQTAGFTGKAFGDELNRRRLEQLKNLNSQNVV